MTATAETRLKWTHGEESEYWERWVYWKSDLFDSYRSYRLLYHLRNRAHEALPPIWFESHSSSIENGEPGAVREGNMVIQGLFPTA